MRRQFHTYPGVIAALLVSFMAITGAFLSLEPVIGHFQWDKVPASTVSVAELANAVATNVPGVERIVKKASGAVIAYSSTDAGQLAQYVNATSGMPTRAYKPSSVFGFVTELHRSLFLGFSGRAVAGVAAGAMVVLSISGLLLLVTRMGGWTKLFCATRGTFAQRSHVYVGRLAIAAFLVTGMTGTYMSLDSFGLLSQNSSGFAVFPSNVDGGTPAPIIDLAALRATPLSDFRELVFPYMGDPTDVFTLTTSAGQGFVDQATGDMLSFTPNSVGQSIYQTIYMLHTGQGVWWLSVILGVAALCVPIMAVGGVLVWWHRRQGAPKFAHNALHNTADTIILVGSEGNTTWGFATVLHDALTKAGHRVHTAPMNALAHEYRQASRLFVLTATYGDGAAPSSANRFMARLEHMKAAPDLAFAVLGFGDRSFAHYCQFAVDVEAALTAKGLPRLLEMGTVDRQSSQAFAQWGGAISEHVGARLQLTHTRETPRTTQLALRSSVSYGAEVQQPTAVLQFVNPKAPSAFQRFLGQRRGNLPRFEAGDLVGIVPPGSPVPRYYSLASSSTDGELEICVRRQSGGLCSEFLHALEPGSTIDAFVRTNADFRPGKGRAPVIMIGAGTGIAPLAGFIRKNKSHRPVHLYWGGRHPQSDFLYQETLEECLADSRLTRLITAFSRIVGGSYVQDKVRDDASEIRALIERGAKIMVCGGKEMAAGVMQVIEEIVSPMGMDVRTLKVQGRYLEDVY